MKFTDINNVQNDSDARFVPHDLKHEVFHSVSVTHAKGSAGSQNQLIGRGAKRTGAIHIEEERSINGGGALMVFTSIFLKNKLLKFFFSIF